MAQQLNIELRAAILATLEADPSQSLQDIALQTGVTKARVHQILKGLGYEYRAGKPQWRKSRTPKRPN